MASNNPFKIKPIKPQEVDTDTVDSILKKRFSLKKNLKNLHGKVYLMLHLY